MKILITGQAEEEVFPFNNSGPWELFKQEIIKHGHEVSEKGFIEKADAVIANSIDKRLLEYMKKTNIPINRRALIVWEPFVVSQKSYKTENLKQFGHVFAPSVCWSSRLNAIPFKWPQDVVSHDKTHQNWSKRQSKIVVIQGNKFSAVQGEMYSTRRRAFKALGTNKLTLYGTNWNKGFIYDAQKWLQSALRTPIKNLSLRSAEGIGFKYKNYQGSITKKSDVLQEFRFALVVENSLDYVSEKLFDAVRAGCIVIYVGPDLSLFDLPENVAIEISPSISQIKQIFLNLLNLSENDQLSIARKQLDALISVSKSWQNTSILPNLASDILTCFSNNSD